jgi:hypothetical protein
MKNQQLFEASFISEVGTGYCSKCNRAGTRTCRCKQFQDEASSAPNSYPGSNQGNETQWLFETPLLELNFYANPTYYSIPEWENAWGSAEFSPLSEEERETVGRHKAPRHPVSNSSARGLYFGRSSCTSAKSIKPRIIYGWSQYKRRVEDLPIDQQAKLRNIGNEIRMSQQGCQPVRRVQIYGYADWDTPRNPQREKQMSIERAQMIAAWLKKDLGNAIATQIIWDIQGFGAIKLKAQPTTEVNRRQNRRVEIFASSSSKASVRTEVGRCGVPSWLASGITYEVGTTNGASLKSCGPNRRCRAVDFDEPKVCLFAAPDALEDPNGLALFFGMAVRWACMSGAIDIKGGVGPEPFKTGNDILLTLRKVNDLLDKRTPKKKIKQVHIFAHMFEEGIIGATDDFLGLYRHDNVHFRSRAGCNPSKCIGRDCKEPECKCNTHEVDLTVSQPGLERIVSPPPPPRILGARTIENIDLDILDDSVIFVLHGCNTANQSPCWVINSTGKNFAQALFERLATKLANPTVFGHFQSVCAGENAAWMEYSKRFQTGKNILSKFVPYHDIGNFCCKKRISKKKAPQRGNLRM